MRDRKTLVFSLLGVFLASGFSAPALAGPSRLHLHTSDFYAYAPEEPSTGPRQGLESAPHATSCYVSFSAAEVSRGIRHWTGKC